MKPIALLLAALVLAACAAPPRARMDPRSLTQRLGPGADIPDSVLDCNYARALPDDEEAEFVSAGTCVVLPDSFVILRAGTRSERMRPAFFRYRALEGVGVAAVGRRSQLQLLTGGVLLVADMEGSVSNLAAQQRAVALAKSAGVPLFDAEFVFTTRRSSAFVPPSF